MNFHITGHYLFSSGFLVLNCNNRAPSLTKRHVYPLFWKAKENSVTAFDENKVTAGSVYVNSITQPVPKIVENIEEKSLIKKPTNYLTNTFSFVGTLFKNVKLAFTKIVNLVKTSFNFGENKE